jgi:branched-chain amino acid transport system permease protein
MAISASLAALAATMLAPIFSVNPWMGHALLLKAFIICVLGGLGRLEGAILGGILLGTVESLTVVFWASEWKDVTAFVLFLAVLWFRPTGLLGTKEW